MGKWGGGLEVLKFSGGFWGWGVGEMEKMGL